MSALIKFSQSSPGPGAGADGRALVGVLGVAVVVENSDNSGVESWEIQLVYAPHGSSVPTGLIAHGDSSSTPFCDIVVPDARGSYRFVLKTWPVPNRVGNPDVDIRVFSVPEPSRSFIQPPAQIWPPPLPPLESARRGAKPNELNFGGQPYGWAGNVPVLVNQVIKITDGDGSGGGGGSVPPLTATVYVDGGTLVDPGDQDGSIGKPYSSLQAAVDANAGSGDFAFINLLVAPGIYAEDVTLTKFQQAYVSIACTVPGIFLDGSVPGNGIYVTLAGVVSLTGTEGGSYLTLQDVRTSSPGSVAATNIGLVRSQLAQPVGASLVVIRDWDSSAYGVPSPTNVRLSDLSAENNWTDADVVSNFNPLAQFYVYNGLFDVSVYVTVISASGGTADLTVAWSDGFGSRQKVLSGIDFSGPGYFSQSFPVRLSGTNLTYSVDVSGASAPFQYLVFFGISQKHEPQ